MKKIQNNLLCTAFIFISFIVAAQTYYPTYQYRMTGNGNLGFGKTQAVQAKPTIDGGTIIAGGIMKSNLQGTWNPMLVKTDFTGKIQICTRLNTTGLLYDALQYDANTYVAVGYLPVQNADYDIFLAFFDTCGNLTRNVVYSSPYLDQPRRIIKTSDGGFIIVGEMRVASTTDLLAVLIKTDATGTLQWSAAYGSSSTSGGTYGTDVIETPDGGYAICGRNNVNNLPFVMKLTSTGAVTWGYQYQMSIQDPTNFNFGTANTIHRMANGDYVIFLSGVGNSGIKPGLMRIDANGNHVWNRFYTDNSTITPKATYLYGGLADADGGFTLFGPSYARTGSINLNEIYLLKTDATGTALYDKFIGVSNVSNYSASGVGFGGQVSDFFQYPNGGYGFAGTLRTGGGTTDDLWVVKTDSLFRSACNYNNVGFTTGSSTPSKFGFTTTKATTITSTQPALAWFMSGSGGDAILNNLVNTYSSICSDVYVGNDSFPNATISGPGKFCALPANGSYFVPDLGPGYVYNWSVSGGNIVSGQGTSNLSVNWTASAGTVTLTYTGKCNKSGTASINVNIGGFTYQTSSQPATCTTAGSVSVNITSGTGPFSYAWSNGANTSTTPVASAGTYTVTITAPGNCSVSASVNVSGNTTPPTATVTPSSATLTCSNPSATLTAGGGASYSWSTGATTNSINPNTAATYTVTVTAANGCTATASAVVSGNITVPVASITPSSATLTCTNTQATLAASGGATYQWSTGSTNTTVTVSTAGNYSVTVTGANGCTASATTSVISSGYISLQSSTTPATCTNSNGIATVTVSSGAGPFSYSWSNSATTSTVNGLAAGTYSVTVNGSGGCSATLTVNVSATPGVTISLTSTNTTCGNSNGTASAAASTGNGTLTYNWSNGATAAAVSNLASGSYTITVKDASNCSATAGFTITPSTAITPVSLTAGNDTICAQDSTQICAPSGFTNYQWNTGDNSRCVFARLAGAYYLTVTDNNGCTASSDRQNVFVRPIPSVSITVRGDTLSTFGAISYQWLFNGLPINGANSQVYVASNPGQYQVKIIDKNGCEATSTTVNITKTSIVDLNGISLRIYPNPSTEGKWFVSVSSELVGSEWGIFNVEGRLVRTGKINDSLMLIDCNLPDGVYLMQILYGNNPIRIRLVNI